MAMRLAAFTLLASVVSSPTTAFRPTMSEDARVSLLNCPSIPTGMRDGTKQRVFGRPDASITMTPMCMCVPSNTPSAADQLSFVAMTPKCVPSRVSLTVQDEISEIVKSGHTRHSEATPSASVDLTRDLIRIESITPNDNGCQAMLVARLEKIGFVCETLQFEDVTNLWAVHGKQKPLLVFAGHTDVVPTGPRELWKFPPFSGTVSEGMLHGRGVADMKGGVACFVVACERFVERHPEHGGSIGVLLTSDEEGLARFGTREVISELSRRGEVIDMCIVGEPTSHVLCGDTIKVGRRGSLSGVLTVYGTQGHVAYPHLADNPLHNALGPLKALVDMEWDRGNESFDATTFQISNINGGTGATNVIPGHKTVHFNFRYSPETNDKEIMKKVNSVLDAHEIVYAIDWSEPAYPFETKRDDFFVDAVRESIQDITGLDAKLSTSGGTSDGRFIAATGAKVVELGLVNASIHQIDERVSVADLDVLTNIYEDLLDRVLGDQCRDPTRN
jgi:succinyl-diaminopimelate desuccinylase